MPLTKNVSQNIKELIKDNQKKGQTMGASGHKRSQAQIIAIALAAAKRNKRR